MLQIWISIRCIKGSQTVVRTDCAAERRNDQNWATETPGPEPCDDVLADAPEEAATAGLETNKNMQQTSLCQLWQSITAH